MLLTDYVSLVPIVAISFVGVLLFYKIYIFIRSKFKISVNCWFCNQSLRVPYNSRNSWDCPNCEQYNGFNEDGDYNREIPAQINSNSPASKYTFAKTSANNISINGLCNTCNENQRIIVEKLAQFEPRNENSYERDVEKFRSTLEHKYRLCVTCERHVCKVLREKKKMILGSKLATFVLQKISLLKSPIITKHLKSSKKLNFRNLSSVCLLCLAVVNFGFVINEWIAEHNSSYQSSNDFLSRTLYMLLIHFVALSKVITGYFQYIWKFGLIEKLYLYIKTLTTLALYTMGFRFGSIGFCFPLMNAANVPFGSIILSFINNILDGFKLGKSALLLTAWSVHAGVSNHTKNDFYGVDILKIITSFITIMLSFPTFKRSTTELLDSTATSFHRIYSEDYFSDETLETSSILNSTMVQKNNKNTSLNSSSSSSRSSVKSYIGKEISPRFLSPVKCRVDATSSFNLHSPVSSKSFCHENSFHLNNIRAVPRNSFIESTMHLPNNCSRPMSTYNSTSFVECKQPNQNNFEYTANRIPTQHTMSPRIQQQALIFSGPDSNSQRSFSSNHLSCRPNVISPSRLTVQAYSMQSSWVSGGYFNSQNKFGQKNYFLESSGPKDNISRASSQSSGFESQGSSLSLQNGDQVFSRENSCCPEECFPSQCELNFNKYNNGRISDNSIGLLPQLNNAGSFNENHESISPVPPAVSPALSYQSLNSNYFANQTILNNSMNFARNSSSPFDLNKMGADLPAIQKGSLLKKWKDQNIVL